MEPSTILVLVLLAGAFALLIWFEMNSRQNEARMKQHPSNVQPESGPPKEIRSHEQSETERRKAA